MGCRDMKKCKKLREEIMEASFNQKVYCKELDLSSMDSIHKFAEDINKSEYVCETCNIRIYYPLHNLFDLNTWKLRLGSIVFVELLESLKNAHQEKCPSCESHQQKSPSGKLPIS